MRELRTRGALGLPVATMNRIKSILVIAERSGEVASALQKACVIARHFGAAIELFACDAEHAYMAEHSYDRRGVSDAVSKCLADSRRFLDAMRSSIAASDLDIRTSVACETPLHAGVLRKVREIEPDLVVRCVEARSTQRHSALTSTDWQLLRTCPAPLMLTRGRSWGPAPRIAAALDLEDDEPSARRLLAAAAYLASGCGGDLEIVHGAAAGSTASTIELLHTLANAAGLQGTHIEVLGGKPEQSLHAFVREHETDVLVLGALSHRTAGGAGLLGTLTESLIERLDCDFLLVRPEFPVSAEVVMAAGNLQTSLPSAGPES
jgi:universal stress protein E